MRDLFERAAFLALVVAFLVVVDGVAQGWAF